MPEPGRDRPFPAKARPGLGGDDRPRSRLPRHGAAAGKPNEEAQRMPLHARIVSLEERHAALERRILDEDSRPRPDERELARLKREKLRIKEEMERLKTARQH